MSGRRIYLNIRHKISQLLNPALCQMCGIPVPSSAYLCSHCLRALPRPANPCLVCGLPNKTTGAICPACLHQPPRWHRLQSPLIYEGHTRDLIHQFKFNAQLHIANALLTHLYPCYGTHAIEALIPVPLHKTRLLERGYNQSAEIAQVLSRLLQIPVDLHSLKRIRATQPQSGLSLDKRRKNILKAFDYQPVHPYTAVAIVDDVITTGSTMTEISRLLLKSGVKHIQVWSLARALKHE